LVEPEPLKSSGLDIEVKSKQRDTRSQRLLDIPGGSDADIESVDPEIADVVTVMEEGREEEATERGFLGRHLRRGIQTRSRRTT
jgi:hypothetical protein